MGCNLPGSSVHGILQARILEQVAIPFSRVSSQPRDWTCIFCIAGIFFTISVTREAHIRQYYQGNSLGNERRIGETCPWISCEFCWNAKNKIYLRELWRQWHPTPVLLPGKSHGWRSLEGCSPWGRWGSNMPCNFIFTFHFPALEKEMATHSSVLAWTIPGMGEPDGLPSMGSHRVGHDWSDLAAVYNRHYVGFWGRN